MENGSTKEYPTSYILNDLDEPFTIASRCGDISCDHLDCAICATEDASKYKKKPAGCYLFACIFWLLGGIVFAKGVVWMGLANPLAGIFALFVIYYIWQSERFAKKAKELIEFRDHGTINGIRAHKL